MKHLALLAFLALALAACAPAVVSKAPASGVTLTATDTGDFTVYRLDTTRPLDLALLRFQGTSLKANAKECRTVDAALECSLGPVQSFFEVAIAGTVTNDPTRPYGVACADGQCSAIYITRPE